MVDGKTTKTSKGQESTHRGKKSEVTFVCIIKNIKGETYAG